MNEGVIEDNRYDMAHLDNKKNYNQSILQEHLKLTRGLNVNIFNNIKFRLYSHFGLKIAGWDMWH